MKLSLHTITLRLVEESDASFILSLRLNEEYNKFMSPVSSKLEDQKSWIRNYKQEEARGNQYYFIIERLDDKVPCGTIRVYDIKSDSFSWGSWILNEKKTRYAALESTFLIYRFGFEHLDFNKSHFEVMKENKKVITFHEKMGAKITAEDEHYFYFEISKDAVITYQEKIMRKIQGVQ